MKNSRISSTIVTVLALTWIGAPSLAHHSFAAEFDAENCRDFAGTLTAIDWQSPHAYFYVDVQEPDGTVNNWSFQTYALITLRRAGNGREIFIENIGKEVWVRGCVARNGKEHYAAAGRLKFAADGVLRQMGQIQN